MAKIVVAGAADCPHYSRVELLADYLAGRLQDFKVHKIVKTSQEWPKWLNTVCQDRGWKHSRSPLVWREILDRGGKGMLIGGAEEFQEYVYGYYGIKSSMISDSMQKIATENFRTKQIVDEEEAERLAQIRPIHIAITNASNDLCYNILPGLADGAVFGRTTELAFHLLDNDDKFSIVEGICMELQDLACPLVRQCTPEKTPNIAFQNCSLIILLDDSHQSETETKEEYFHSVHSLYNAYASVIAVAASKDVKLLVAGRGPVNFIATCLIESLPDLPPENIVAMSRGIENHAKGVIAEKLKINASIVADVIVWGNPNGSYLIDISRSRLHEYNSAIWGPGYLQPTIDMIHDDKWLASDFMQLVKKRHSAIKDQVKHEISVSDGQAICSLVKHWIQGTSSERIFSLGVWSGGWYEIPQGIVFSVPVHFPGAGKWNIVMDVDLSETHKDTLITITEELLDEREIIFPNPTRVKRIPKSLQSKTNSLPPENEQQISTEITAETPTAEPVVPPAGRTEEEAEQALQKIEEDVIGEEMAAKTEEEEEPDVGENADTENKD